MRKVTLNAPAAAVTHIAFKSRSPIALLLHNPNSSDTPWPCHSKRGPSYGHFCGLQSCYPRRLTGPGCHGEFCMPTDSRMHLGSAHHCRAWATRWGVTSKALLIRDTVLFFVGYCALNTTSQYWAVCVIQPGSAGNVANSYYWPWDLHIGVASHALTQHLRVYTLMYKWWLKSSSWEFISSLVFTTTSAPLNKETKKASLLYTDTQTTKLPRQP